MHRSITLLLLLVLLAAGTLKAQQRKAINETVRLSPRGEVVIDTYKGSITVTTWDRDEVDIDVRIEADGDGDLVDDTEIQIRHSGDRLTLETDYDAVERKNHRWFGNNSYSLPFAHYTIRMPRTATLRIDDYKSDIRVEGLHADLNLETYKGVVDIRDHDGAMRLETYKGDVTVDFVELADHSSFETYKGTIDIRLPRDAGFDLDANLGRRGDLDADFRTSGFRNNDNHYRGEVQGGGPRLSLDTYKGTYRLRTR